MYFSKIVIFIKLETIFHSLGEEQVTTWPLENRSPQTYSILCKFMCCSSKNSYLIFKSMVSVKIIL